MLRFTSVEEHPVPVRVEMSSAQGRVLGRALCGALRSRMPEQAEDDWSETGTSSKIKREQVRGLAPSSRTYVLAPPVPCRRVISDLKKTLLKRSWHDELTCSISVELTRKMVTAPTAWIDAWRFAPRT